MIERENNQSKFFYEDYNKIVPQEELKRFDDEIKARVASKAKEIGITEEDLLRLSRLSEPEADDILTEEEKKEREIFFQEELAKKAKDLNVPPEKLFKLVIINLDNSNDLAKGEPGSKPIIKRGDFENIKYNLEEALKEMEDKNNFSLSTESIAAHKGKISIGSLLLYLSSAIACAPVLKWFADKEKNKAVYGEELNLQNLEQFPGLIRQIDEFNNENTPLDILEAYYPAEPLVYDDVFLEFKTYKEINSNGDKEKVVHIENLFDDRNPERIEAFKNNFKNLANSVGGAHDSLPLDNFMEKEEKIKELIINDLGIPEEEADKYLERFLVPDTSKISIVPLKDFKIFTGNDSSKKIQELDKKEREYSNTFVLGGQNDTAAKDQSILRRGAADNDGSLAIKFMNFKEAEELKGSGKMENNLEQFRELFIKALEDDGETIDHLKEVSQDHPEKIMEIISKVLGKNISYDYKEAENIMSDKWKDVNEKHKKGISFSTIETGFGVCHDYAATVAAAKKVLEEEGLPNLDKFMVLSTASYSEHHAWTILITFDEKGRLVISSLDLTVADDEDVSKIPGQLNAVDKNHSYSARIQFMEKIHQKALDKILEYNRLVEMEKLREMIMQYKKEYGILIDKE